MATATYTVEPRGSRWIARLTCADINETPEQATRQRGTFESRQEAESFVRSTHVPLAPVQP